MVNSTLALVCMGILLVIGICAPIIDNAFEADITEDNNADAYIEDVPDSNPTFLGFWDVIRGLGSIFAWSFGLLPVWLDLLLVFPRIVMIMYLVELARGV